MKKILFFFLLLVVFFSFKTIDVQSAACSLATTPYASPTSGTTGSKIKLYWHNQACDYVDLHFDSSGNESFIAHDAQSGYEITMTSPGPETYAIKAYSYSACSPGLNPVVVDAQSGLLLCQTQKITVKPLPLVNFLVNGRTSTIGTPTSYQTFSGSVIGMVGCDMMAYGPDDPSRLYKNMGGVGVSGDNLPLNFSNQNGLFTPYSDGGFNFTLICSDGTGLPSGIIRKTVYVDFSTPVTAPLPPTGLSVTPSTCGNNWLNLSWNVSAGATSYQVYRGGSPISLSYVCGATSCAVSDTGLNLGSTYSYTVTASNGGGTSLATGQVSGTVASACVHSITFNGNGHTGGSMANQSITDNTSANLTANAYTKTGYTFAGWNTLANGSGTSYANGASFSMGTSNVTLYAQWTQDPPPPPPPTDTFTITAGTCGTTYLNLAWSAVTGAVSYQIYRSPSVTPIYSGTNLSYQDTGLNTGNTYTYTRVAINSSGNQFNGLGGQGTVASACPITPVPVISSFTANPTTGQVGVVNPGLSWTVTNSPTLCTATGDWSGSKPTSGNNISQGVLNSVKTYTFTLTCSNGGGASAPKSVTVVVTAAPPTTATINVTSNVSTGWCINGVNCVSGMTSKTYTVTPASSGTSYTIVGNTVNNYSGPTITNNVTGSGSTFVLFPGDSGTFNLSYTPVGNPPGSFDYSLGAPNAIYIQRGSSGQFTLTASLITSPTQVITLSVFEKPENVSVQPSTCFPFSTPTCTSTVTVDVPSSISPGEYKIIIKGSPLSKSITIPLHVTSGGPGGGGSMSVTCSSSALQGQARVGEPITWTATVTDGTPPYTYKWSGDSIPNNPPPTYNQNGKIGQYNIAYTTTGTKGAQVEVIDSSQTGALRKECVRSVIQVKVNPTFKEQ